MKYGPMLTDAQCELLRDYATPTTATGDPDSPDGAELTYRLSEPLAHDGAELPAGTYARFVTGQHVVAYVVISPEAAVREYAEKIMTFIREDIDEGFVPADVASFSDLHSHVDANMYLEHAGQDYDGTEESLAEINAIENEVDRQIKDGML